jgi:hypothetical protein
VSPVEDVLHERLGRSVESEQDVEGESLPDDDLLQVLHLGVGVRRDGEKFCGDPPAIGAGEPDEQRVFGHVRMVGEWSGGERVVSQSLPQSDPGGVGAARLASWTAVVRRRTRCA